MKTKSKVYVAIRPDSNVVIEGRLLESCRAIFDLGDQQGNLSENVHVFSVSSSERKNHVATTSSASVADGFWQVGKIYVVYRGAENPNAFGRLAAIDGEGMIFDSAMIGLQRFARAWIRRSEVTGAAYLAKLP